MALSTLGINLSDDFTSTKQDPGKKEGRQNNVISPLSPTFPSSLPFPNNPTLQPPNPQSVSSY